MKPRYEQCDPLRAASLALKVHLRGHLGEFPSARPFDTTTVLASRQFVENQLAKITALASQHKLFRKRLGSFEEAKLRISNNADAFERHQRAHDVSEVCRQPERILINHFRQVISQLFKLHLPELEIQINFK